MKNLFSRFVSARLALVAAVGMLLSTSAHAWHRPGNLVDRLAADGRFTTLLTALEVAGLKNTVATGGVFTILAPTDEAFAALPPGTVEALVANPPALANVLLYHALSGKQSLGELLEDSTATTLQGNPVLFLREGRHVLVNRQQIIWPWLPARNGVIYPIEGVLIPTTNTVSIDSLVDVLALDGRFTTLIAAAQAAGLAETLSTGGPFTVFAPTDDAFAKLPAGTVENLLANPDALRNVLLYHVLGERKSAFELIRKRTAETLQGSDVAVKFRHGTVFVNDSRVINPNVNTPNGVVHVIDTVLLPPLAETNILETLRADGRFGTLLAALQAAGLDTVVTTGGPFTLFAPTDDAFAALPAGTVEALLANIDALKNVLLYHVVSGDKTAGELLRERSVETLQGSDVRVWMWWNGTVFVNRSQVIDPNIGASNGIVHVINKVLLPPADHDDDDLGDDDDDDD